MEKPLVSVICLCYNQARFVRETLQSVLHQTYSNIELIIVDDGSSDNSVEVINEIVAGAPNIVFLPLEKNVGNCKAFNLGFKRATGSYVFDLAADDVLMPERIERQVLFFESLDPSYGVVFTDAEYIDERGKFLRTHYEYLFKNKLLKSIPEGDVYKDVVGLYFICTPSMIARREVFDVLNGYDESLDYEDFDFCIRASRIYKFAFLNENLTKVRKVSNSMSTKLYNRNDKQLYSTYLICRKIQHLNRTEEENFVLVKRLRYELRQSVFTQNSREAILFYDFLREMKAQKIQDTVLFRINKLRLPLRPIRTLYLRLRYGKS